MTNSSETPEPSKGPETEDPGSGFSLNSFVRTEALVLLLVVLALACVYVYFFLDDHLEWALEEGLTRSVGAQVDVHDVQTSFRDPSLSIRGIQITNRDRPTHNLFELGQLSLSLSWPGLFRSKLLFEDIQLREIAYGTKRSSTGRVVSGGGALKGVFDALKGMATAQVKSQSEGTLVENVVSLLEGTDFQQQLESMKDRLQSLEQARAISDRIEQLKSAWQKRLNELPGQQELDEIKRELESIKASRSDPAQIPRKLEKLQQSVDRLKNVRKNIQKYRESFSDDYAQIGEKISGLSTTIQEDREALRQRFRLPSLDVENFSRQLFQNFLEGQSQSISQMVERARRYIPAGKGTVKPTDPERPRAEGVNYLFRTENTDPSWWVKKAIIDARVPETLGGGTLSADLRDLSSNPAAVAQPALIRLNGELPGAPVKQIEGMLELDHRTDEPTENFRVSLRKLAVENWSILQSSKYRFVIEEALGTIETRGTVRGSQLQASLQAVFDQPRFQVESQVDWLKSVLDSAVRSLSKVTLDGEAHGALKDLKWNVRSNLGGALSRSLESQVRSRIQGAQEKLVSRFNNQIGELTGNLKGNRGDLRSLVTGRLGNVDSRVQDLLGLAGDKSGRIEGLLKDKSGPLKDKQKELMKDLENKLKF